MEIKILDHLNSVHRSYQCHSTTTTPSLLSELLHTLNGMHCEANNQCTIIRLVKGTFGSRSTRSNQYFENHVTSRQTGGSSEKEEVVLLIEQMRRDESGRGRSGSRGIGNTSPGGRDTTANAFDAYDIYLPCRSKDFVDHAGNHGLYRRESDSALGIPFIVRVLSIR
jgi:hypothetical protein